MALFKKKTGGTAVGNILRSIVGKPAPSPMVFTVGQGLNPTQTVAAYTALGAKNPVKSAVAGDKYVTKQTSTPKSTSNIDSGYVPAMTGKINPYNRTQPTVSNANIYTSGPNQNFTALPGRTNGTPTPTNTVNRVSGGSTGSSSVTSGGSTGSSSVTSGGSTGSGTGSLATPTGAATIGSSDFNYNKSPQQIAEEEALKRVQDYNDSQSNTDTNYENIMRDTLRQFQGEIDATNAVYADKLRVAGIQGQSRLGQQRAENFNSGAVNSSFGNAAQDRTQSYNNDIEAGIQAQKLQSLAQIENSARELGNRYYEQKKAAKESGLAGYLENIKSAGTQKEAIAQDIATSMINSGLTVDEISPAKLELIAKNAGVPVQQIKNTFTAVKDARDKAAAEAAIKGQFDLSEGQARYDATGKMIASRSKTYAPKSGGSGSGSGSYGGVGETQVSSAAQNILNQLNTNGGTVDDYIKGSSKDAQKLRNEVYTALNNQGGRNDVSTNLLKDARDVVNDLITTKSYKDLGGYSTKLGGQLTQSFGDAKARVAQLSALLARDNLGLLKGAMSDKDLAFIQAMSTGFEGQGVQSEKYIKEKLDTIYTKLNNKVGNTNNVVSSTNNKTTKNTGTTSLKGPDGKRYSVPNDQVDAFIKAGGSRI